MSKKKLQYITVLYKNGSFDEVREDRLEKKHVDSHRVKYLIFPDLTRNLVYNIVKPTSLLLAKRFESDMLIQGSDVEFDEGVISPFGTIPSECSTESVVEFIQYITTLYRLYGFAEIMESSNMLKDYQMSFVFYPIEYSTRFYDDHDRLMETIHQKLPRASGEMYLERDIFAWITEDRMRGYQEILFQADAPKGDESVMDTPRIIRLFTNRSWIPVKKPKHLDNERALFRIDGFGGYLLISKHIWELMTGKGSIDLWTYSYIEPELYDDSKQKTAFRVEMLGQIQQLFERGLVENFHGYDLVMHWEIRDPYVFSQWLAYGEDIISYINIVTYFAALKLSDEEMDEEMTNTMANLSVPECVTYLWMDNPSTLLTNQDIMRGKLKSNLLSRLK